MREEQGAVGGTHRRGPSPRLVLVATLLSVLVVGGALLAAPMLLGQLVRSRIVEEARARGVELSFDGVSFFWWSVSLEGVRFRLVDVSGLEGRAESVDVTVRDFDPRRISATDVRVDVTGSAADLALSLGEWTRLHPKAYAIAVTATNVTASYRASAAEPPWLVVTGGALVEADRGVRFAAADATLSGVSMGRVEALWTEEATSVSMGFGAATLDAAPLKLVVRHSASPPTATIALSPTDLARLSGPFGVALPVAGVTASGTANLTFTTALEAGPITGSLEARLDGWIPPHPVELDGFLFGNTTVFTSRFDVSKERTLVKLTNGRVRAAAFELAGGGTIERRQDYATIRMSFAGNLPCAAVAESAAAAHVGSFLSALIGSAARRVMDGAVAVKVSIVADTRHLADARVDPTVGVGCGLAPVSGLDAKRLAALPQELRDFARALPALPRLPPHLAAPGNLPTLPSAFPFPFPAPAPASSR